MGAIRSKGGVMRVWALDPNARPDGEPMTFPLDDITIVHNYGTVRPGWPTFAEWQSRRFPRLVWSRAASKMQTVTLELTEFNAAAIAALSGMEALRDVLGDTPT